MKRLVRWSGLASLVSVSLLTAGDWTNWRGPDFNGVSRESNLIDSFKYETGDRTGVLWESPIGGRATPIVMNGKLYLNCKTEHNYTREDQRNDCREQVVCWEAETGKLLWQDVFNVNQTDIPHVRVGWASLAGDPETGNVYCHSVGGLFRCYTGDGKLLWQRSLFEEFGKISGYGGRTHTPLVDEDRVIVSFIARNWGEFKGPAPKHLYLAFNKRTGVLEWMVPVGGTPTDTNCSQPVVAVIDGQRLLFGGNADGGVYAIQARTGKTVWGHLMSKRGIITGITVVDNFVYTTHGEDNLDSTKFGRIECLDAKTGKSVWRVDGIKAGYSTPTIAEGILYQISDNGKLYAFDANTGKQLWRFSLGTVGKGSPVFADGKLYATETNGKLWILKPSRDKCEPLSKVHLRDASGKGDDEIYASPAIANGRVYWVSRDRTICVGKPERNSTPETAPAMPAELPADTTIAQLQLIPYEVIAAAGDKIDYTIKAFDANGRFIKTCTAPLVLKDLPGSIVNGMSLTTGPTEQGGTVSVTVDGVTTTARLRSFPPLPRHYDFASLKPPQTPAGWLGAFAKLKAEPAPGGQPGDIAMLNKGPFRSAPSTYVLLGGPTMTGYTIQSDILMREMNNDRPNIGIAANRYNLVLRGKEQKLEVIDWPPHPRVQYLPNAEADFAWDTETWYTIKLRVDVQKDGQAQVRGKVWKRGTAEPTTWLIDFMDPHGNANGSPMLYTYCLGDSYFDNVSITENQE